METFSRGGRVGWGCGGVGGVGGGWVWVWVWVWVWGTGGVGVGVLVGWGGGIHRSLVNSPHKDQWRGAWCFLWSAPKPTIDHSFWRHCNALHISTEAWTRLCGVTVQKAFTCSQIPHQGTQRVEVFVCSDGLLLSSFKVTIISYHASMSNWSPHRTGNIPPLTHQQCLYRYAPISLLNLQRDLNERLCWYLTFLLTQYILTRMLCTSN